MDMYIVECLSKEVCGFIETRIHANVNTKCKKCGGDEIHLTFGKKVIRDDSTRLGNGKTKML